MKTIYQIKKLASLPEPYSCRIIKIFAVLTQYDNINGAQMADNLEYPHTLEWLQTNNKISGDFVSNHCISWIDILGFKNKMNSSRTDLNEYLIRVNRAVSDSLKMLDVEHGTKLEHRIFSDNIIIFVKLHNSLSDIFDINNVILCTTYIQAILTCNFGIQVRGCICKGLFYSNDKFVFGPALVKAYEAESSEVKMPRIMIDESIFTTISEYGPDVSSSFHKQLEKELTIEDSRFYIDYYSIYTYEQAKKSLPCIHDSMELIILEFLIDPNPEVMDKIDYTISKFNKFCKKFKFDCMIPELKTVYS